MPETETWFRFFKEVGIIDQLARALLEAHLPPPYIAPHFTVLNHLVRVRDGRTPLELATAFQVPKTSMTHTLAGLERGGLVEMRPNPEDGRSKRVWLTDDGRAFRQRIIASLRAVVTRLSDRLDPAKVIRLIEPLAEIRRVLDDDRDG